MSKVIPTSLIQNRILLIRGFKVIIDADLARLYGVTTKRLNEQVKRNKSKFPADFVVQLTKKEKDEVVAICDHLKSLKFSAVLPLAFTEHGALMVSSILNTPMAVKTSIFVVRAFVKLREWLADNKELGLRIRELETQIGNHAANIQSLWQTIDELRVLPQEKFPEVKGFKDQQ